ncbi:hypothetical protein CFC21_030737, partial [Triticum aestivum]
WP